MSHPAPSTSGSSSGKVLPWQAGHVTRPSPPWPVAATPVMVLGHGVGGHQPHYAASMPGHFPHLDWVPCRHMPCCYLLEFAEFVGNYVDGPSVIGTLKWLGATLLQKSV